MPVFFQQPIKTETRLAAWKIEETEEFFSSTVPLHHKVLHPHKRLQHFAGRYLLRYLFPDFPYHLIEIADTRKPFLPTKEYHFSISHCGDYAAAIVSKHQRVGIDIEIPTETVERIRFKFLGEEELDRFNVRSISQKNVLALHPVHLLTLLWSAKESVFKWYGAGNVDFRKDIIIKTIQADPHQMIVHFLKNDPVELTLHYRIFEHLVLTWLIH